MSDQLADAQPMQPWCGAPATLINVVFTWENRIDWPAPRPVYLRGVLGRGPKALKRRRRARVRRQQPDAIFRALDRAGLVPF